MNPRQLRVSEKIRHALSSIFLQGKIYEPELYNVSITVSEVRITPDLKYAQIYVSPLGGSNDPEAVLKVLNQASPQIRTMLAKKIDLRYSPKLHFKLDNSFDYASKIDALLKEHQREKELIDSDV